MRSWKREPEVEPEPYWIEKLVVRLKERSVQTLLSQDGKVTHFVLEELSEELYLSMLSHAVVSHSVEASHRSEDPVSRTMLSV